MGNHQWAEVGSTSRTVLTLAADLCQCMALTTLALIFCSGWALAQADPVQVGPDEVAQVSPPQSSAGQGSPKQDTNSHTGQALWNETTFPVVRSLAELRRLQTEAGHFAFEVDLQAQLTFASRYWNVFFVQDGELPAMIHCTDAASSILYRQLPGKWLRIRGLVYEGHFAIQLVGLELLPETLPLNALRIETLPAAHGLRPDRFVEMPCRLLEAMNRPSQTVLFAEIKDKVVELDVEASLTPIQNAAVESQALATVSGTLSPKHDKTINAYCAVRMMDRDQLRITEPATEQTTEPPPLLQGQILFSDHISQVIVSAPTATRVSTRFAEVLVPGMELAVWAKPPDKDKQSAIQAQRLTIVKEGSLPADMLLSVGAWELARELPARVTLEASSCVNGWRGVRAPMKCAQPTRNSWRSSTKSMARGNRSRRGSYPPDRYAHDRYQFQSRHTGTTQAVCCQPERYCLCFRPSAAIDDPSSLGHVGHIALGMRRLRMELVAPATSQRADTGTQTNLLALAHVL